MQGIAVFCNDIRDAVKGHHSRIYERGFDTGKSRNEETVKICMVASNAHSQVDYSKGNNSQCCARYKIMEWTLLVKVCKIAIQSWMLMKYGTEFLGSVVQMLCEYYKQKSQPTITELIAILLCCLGRIRTLTGGTRIRRATITPQGIAVLRVQS